MLTQRKNSKYWYAVLYVSADKPKKWFSTKTTNKRKAKQIHDKLKATIDEVRSKQRITAFINDVASSISDDIKLETGTPLEFAWQTFLKHNTVKGDTLVRRTRVFNNFSKWIEKSVYSNVENIELINPIMCNAFLVDTYGDKTDATYNNQLSHMKCIWDLVKMPLALKENPWVEVKRRNDGEDKSWRNFTLPEVLQILHYCKEKKYDWYCASMIAYYTGLRKIDIVNLEWENIKTTDNGIFIEMSVSKSKKQKKKVVRVYLHPDLVALFESITRKGKYIFPEFHKRYNKSEGSRTALSKVFMRVLKALNIKDMVCFHSWRHTFTTLALEQGVDVKTVGGIVGHSNPRMTARYDHDLESGKAIQNLPSLSNLLASR